MSYCGLKERHPTFWADLVVSRFLGWDQEFFFETGGVFAARRRKNHLPVFQKINSWSSTQKNREATNIRPKMSGVSSEATDSANIQPFFFGRARVILIIFQRWLL